MSVRIGHRKVTLFGEEFPYDAYWLRLAVEEPSNDSGPRMMANVLQQWAAALDEAAAGDVLCLPLSPDDEGTEGFVATVTGDDEVVLERVFFPDNGYSLDLFDLRAFITAGPDRPTTDALPHERRAFARRELVAALNRAEVEAGIEG